MSTSLLQKTATNQPKMATGLRAYYICGPPGFVEAMKKMLKEEMKIPKERIVEENFAGY